MSRFHVGDIVQIDDRPARIVWLRENANEIEAMDEYMVEFIGDEAKQRRFVLSSAVVSKQTETIHDRKSYSDSCQRETH
jgi:hypothetical protein